MKKTFLSLLTVASISYLGAQDVIDEANEEVVSTEETDYSDQNYVKFTKDQRKFDSWSVGLYAGYAGIAKGEFTSVPFLGSEDFGFGYDIALNVMKHINHTIGIAVEGQFGKTKQSTHDELYTGETKYMGVSALGDLNLSSLFRRVDNRSRYAWALHTYAGVGMMGYTAEGFYDDKKIEESEIDLDGQSFYGKFGAGLQYKLNQNFDIELRGMYHLTGDEEFDGSGAAGYSNSGVAPLTGDDDGDDNFFTTSLGVIYKIGKHDEHLKWFDPLADLYTKTEEKGDYCVKGDEDKDTVCDDWDCELNTMLGARVDGCGKALDVDLDGIIDLEDKCVTVFGYRDSSLGVGCPYPEEKIIDKPVEPEKPTIEYIPLPDFQFYYNEARWYPEYNAMLDNAAKIMLANPNATYEVEGHTDARGSDAYNKTLSQKRSDAIVRYLVSKGVPSSSVKGIGYGETQLLNHCVNNVKCTDEEHRVNRRVLIRASQKLIRPAGL